MSAAERRGRPAWVAVLDDDAAVRRAVERLGRTHGLAVHGFADAGGLLAACMDDPPHAVVLDAELAALPPETLAALLRRLSPDIPLILATGCDAAPLRRLPGGTASCLLVKPFGECELLAALAAVGIAPPAVQPRRP